MKYKFLALDLDGTLTTTEKEVTEYTKEVLLKYMNAGGQIVLASGRPVYGIKPVADILGLDKHGGFILAYNGGEIIDCRVNRSLVKYSLKEQIAKEAYQTAKQYGLSVVTYEGDHLVTEDPENKYICEEAFINKMAVKKVEDFCSYVSFSVPKCLIVGDAKKLGVIEPQIASFFVGKADKRGISLKRK